MRHYSDLCWSCFGCFRDVCLSVRPSVTRWHCAKTKKKKKIAHRPIGPLWGSSFLVDLWAGDGETQLSYHASWPEFGWPAQLAASMPTVLVTWPTVTQNVAFSSLAVAVTIGSTHFACPRRDDQAELAWVAWYADYDWCFHCKSDGLLQLLGRNLQCDRNTIHKNLVLCLCLAELIFIGGIIQYDKPVWLSSVSFFTRYNAREK